MPDLKAALTEALRAALGRLWTEPEDDADKPDWDALPGKLADVLLALPGVAVIQLPEPGEGDWKLTRRSTNTHRTGLQLHGEHVEQVWREACTIRTAEQLDALPAQSVVQSDAAATGDGNPWTWERFDEGWFTTAFSPDGTPDLPARLIWHPEWVRPCHARQSATYVDVPNRLVVTLLLERDAGEYIGAHRRTHPASDWPDGLVYMTPNGAWLRVDGDYPDEPLS